MVVQHNITAINANRYFGINNNKLAKSLEKLSSGYAINRAGDNAAGLAVSEKMRSQIAGINQGVKNAQDGISMIQTFEGALTETDSILQRMKVLADQSANGTYQNEVDRDAIQLEFNQLNDELNQIADTDFNGVVVLNGGQMADGTKAVNGKFDYANRVRDSKALTASDITALDYQDLYDFNNNKGVTKADLAWNSIGGWDRADPDNSNDGPDEIEITLKYDGVNNSWSVTDASTGDTTKFTPTSSKNGGFKVAAGGVNLANVVLDQTSLVNGDTVTLKIKNPMSKVEAPTNAGVTTEKITNTLTEGTDTNATKLQDADLKITIDANLDKTKMTEDIKKILDELNKSSVTVTYKNNAATAKGDMSLSINGKTTNGKGTTGEAITLTNGAKMFVEEANDGKLSIYAGKDNTGTKIADIEMTKQTSTANGSAGTVTYGLKFENYDYDTSTLPSVEVVDSGSAAVSKSNAYSQATAPLTYTNHVMLQAGARTKDLVDFTFKYTSDGLGDLKADLDCSARGLGTDKLSLATQEDANYAIDRIDNAINKTNMVRATFGAVQNRLEHKIDNLNVTSENLTSAESRIRDTNMAEEMMNFTKNQILSQASQSMLAQANQLPQGVLSLLQ